MPALSSLDPLAIAVAGAVGGALGALWYSPVLLGPAWIAAAGKGEEDLAFDATALVGSLLSCLVAAAAVEWLVTACGVTTAVGGAGIGALLGFGIVAMTMLSDSLFSGWGWTLYGIQTGYRALYLVLMGAISGGWPA